MSPALAGQSPPLGAAPPLLSSPHPRSKKSGLSPLAIVAICAGALGLLLVIGLMTFGLLLARQHTRARAAAERELAAERAAALAADARAAGQAGAVSFAPRRSEPGLTYTNIRIASEPWSVHVLKVDRTQKDLEFLSAHARNKVLGVSLLADQARSVPRELGRALAAINGDFYLRDDPTYGGDPRGLQIMNGDLISGPSTVCIWFDAQGNPHLDEVKGDFAITWPGGSKTAFSLNQRRTSGMSVLYTPTYGPSTRVNGGRELVLEKSGDGPWLPLEAGQTYRARVREVQSTGNTPLAADAMVLSIAPDLLEQMPGVKPGDTLQISTATTPDLKGVKNAIAGGPALIEKGKPFSILNPPPGSPGGYSEASKYQRHPRSAIGWSPTHFYFVVVDGRQPGLSVGMKLAELAQFMAKLGCTDAMNLDGGKSAQLWMAGRIMNSPAQGEDTVANSLLVVRKNAAN